MRSRKQPNKVKPYTSRQNQNINHSGSNYNNTYDNSNNTQHTNNNNNKQNYNNMYQQQQQQQPPQYQLMMTNSMMQIQSKQTKQTQPKEKESTEVNETNNNNTLPNKKHMYPQQISRGTYNNNKNTQFQYKEHHHHPHYQQNQQQQQNNSLSNSDSLNLSMSSETTSQQAQTNQPLSRNSFISERSSAPPPNYATFTPTYIINDPSFISNYPLPINMYNPQSNIQMNQGKFPTFALGQNTQGNAGQVGVGQQKKTKAQVKGNQPQNIMLNMNYNNMMGIPFPIGVNSAVNMKNNWNAQQQQQQQTTNNKNMPFNQSVANTPMQNIMNNVMLNNNNNSSNNSNVLQQHQQLKTNNNNSNNNNKHHFMPFPRTVHSDKCIVTTPDIFGKNYKQQFTNTNDNNNNNNSTLHTQNKQIFNTINIKLKLPTNNNTSSSPINTEFKLNLNDDIHKAINTHILTNNIDPKYTDTIYQKVLKGINLLTNIPETKLPKTSLKTLHDIHNLNTLLSTTNISTEDLNNTILDANTSFSYLIESTQYEKYISSLKPTTVDYERYHKLTYSI